jgi:hypothetical protein
MPGLVPGTHDLFSGNEDVDGPAMTKSMVHRVCHATAKTIAGAAAVLDVWLAFSAAFAFVVPPGRSVAVIAPAGASAVAAAGGVR